GPSTPQNQEMDLPPRHDTHRSASPATSMIAVPGSTLLTSSMTPPPSSQNPNSRHALTSSRQSPTPNPSILSSPPPTIVNGAKREPVGSFKRPPPDQIASAGPEELREMLHVALSYCSTMDISAREARMSEAHCKLQYNLLTIESEEAVKHLEVEHDMTLREVELLQMRVRDAQAPPELDMYKKRCQKLEDLLSNVSEQLRRAKRLIISKDDDLSDMHMETKQLRDRIRQNRKHINEMRSPGGPLHITSLQNSPVTPQNYRSTPKHTPMTNRSIRQARDHSQEPFAALLLADRVLSQENNSAPSTPIISRRPDPRTPNRHSRGVQSLSSLPNTPRSGRPGTANSTLLPSVQFSPQAETRVANGLIHGIVQQSRERRHKSRDSTISASDTEEIARAAAEYRGESQDVPESQASQSATEMLRLDPRESFEVAASRTTTPIPTGDKSLQQSKIFGGLTKPVVEKRKRKEEYSREYSAKKVRSNASGGIGLGIGLDSTRA
ncbi:hypothetical protein LAWI1_G008727, partial [Lachnellula willkommii]